MSTKNRLCFRVLIINGNALSIDKSTSRRISHLPNEKRLTLIGYGHLDNQSTDLLSR